MTPGTVVGELVMANGQRPDLNLPRYVHRMLAEGLVLRYGDGSGVPDLRVFIPWTQIASVSYTEPRIDPSLVRAMMGG